MSSSSSTAAPSRAELALANVIMFADQSQSLAPLQLGMCSRFLRETLASCDEERRNIDGYVHWDCHSAYNHGGGAEISSGVMEDAMDVLLTPLLPDDVSRHGYHYQVTTPVEYQAAIDPTDTLSFTLHIVIHSCRHYSRSEYYAGIPNGEAVTLHMCDNGQTPRECVLERVHHITPVPSIDDTYLVKSLVLSLPEDRPYDIVATYREFMEGGEEFLVERSTTIPRNHHFTRAWSRIGGDGITAADAFALYETYLLDANGPARMCPASVRHHIDDEEKRVHFESIWPSSSSSE